MAQGLEPLVLDVTTDCGTAPFSFSWIDRTTGMDISTQPQHSFSEPLSETTEFQITVSDPVNSRSQTGSVHVLVHPVTLDHNGDGLNNIDDLLPALPLWKTFNSQYEAIPDNDLNILDYLHIKL